METKTGSVYRGRARERETDRVRDSERERERETDRVRDSERGRERVCLCGVCQSKPWFEKLSGRPCGLSGCSNWVAEN